MNKIKGFLCAMIAAATYGMNPLFGIPLYNEGMNPLSVLFYRFAFAAVLMGILVLCSRNSFILKKCYLPVIFTAGILMALTCLFWFLTFRIMDSGIAATLLFIYPVMVTAVMWIFFKEKLTAGIVSGIVLALTGAVLLCQSGSSAKISALGVLFVMLSALAYALYIVLMKMPRAKEIPADVLTFYAMVVSVVIFLLPLRMGFDLQMLPSLKALGNAVCLALFPSLCAFLFTATAVHYIGPTRTAILGAVEPLTAVTIGITVFGEKLSGQLVCGMIMIIFAVIVVICNSQTTPDTPEKLPETTE